MSNWDSHGSSIKRFRSIFEEPIFIKDGERIIRIDDNYRKNRGGAAGSP